MQDVYHQRYILNVRLLVGQFPGFSRFMSPAVMRVFSKTGGPWKPAIRGNLNESTKSADTLNCDNVKP